MALDHKQELMRVYNTMIENKKNINLYIEEYAKNMKIIRNREEQLSNSNDEKKKNSK